MLIMNLHTIPRPIYMTRHGQSEFNLQDKVGGDSNLTENGKKYGFLLGQYFKRLPEVIYNAVLYTSTMKRTK